MLTVGKDGVRSPPESVNEDINGLARRKEGSGEQLSSTQETREHIHTVVSCSLLELQLS